MVSSNYQWLNCDSNYSVINSANSKSFSPFQNGTYSVEIENNGCIDTSSCIILTPCNNIELIHVSDASICNTSSSTLTILNSYDSYTWSNGGVSNSNIVSDSSIYSALVFNNNGCMTYTDSVQINLYDCSLFIDTVTNNVDTCIIDSTVIVINSYINNIVTSNDSIYVTWNFFLNTGDTVFLDASYIFNQNGVYSIGITIDCNGLKSNGNTYYDMIEINHLTTDIIENKSTYSLYPNPTSKEISISSNKASHNVTIELISIHGAVLRKQTFENFKSTNINIESLENSVYILKITNQEQGTTLHKLIKTN